MNALGPTAAAFGRALIIALLAVAMAGALSGWLAAQRGRAQTLAWTLLLAPFFTPPLLISYAYSKFALALILSPSGHEAFYLAVLALKLIPLGVLIRALVPTPLSAEAWHLYRMQTAAPWRERARFRIRGAGRGPWIAGALVFLLAFADFELASLWSIHSWTITIFDAQTGGLALAETLRLAALPLLVEIATLALVWRFRDEFREAPPDAREKRGRLPWIYLAVAATLVALLPLAIVAAQAVTGIPALLANFVLGREIGVSVLFAVAAAGAAAVLAWLARGRIALAVPLALPGLLGTLTVSLVVLALFQIPLLRWAYDTPLPLLIALTVLLLPLAIVLGTLWLRPSPALHIARQTGDRRLLWELHARPRAIALGLLFCWAYFDFTASSILAPVGFTPVFVRLHNLAHYGQTAVLSAMMLAAFAAPVLVWWITSAAASFFAQRLSTGRPALRG